MTHNVAVEDTLCVTVESNNVVFSVPVEVVSTGVSTTLETKSEDLHTKAHFRNNGDRASIGVLNEPLQSKVALSPFESINQGTWPLVYPVVPARSFSTDKLSIILPLPCYVNDVVPGVESEAYEIPVTNTNIVLPDYEEPGTYEQTLYEEPIPCFPLPVYVSPEDADDDFGDYEIMEEM